MSNDQQPPHYPQPQYPGEGPQSQSNPQYALNSGGMPPSKPKKPIYKRVWFWIVIAVVILGIFAALGGGSKGGDEQKSGSDKAASAPATSQAKEADKSAGKPAEKPAAKTTDEDQVKGDLALLKGWKLKKDEFSAHVTGYVRNNSDESISNYIQIEFNAYDASGSNTDTCLANTNTIDAHGKWKFDAICSQNPSEIKTVKLKDLTGA